MVILIISITIINIMLVTILMLVSDYFGIYSKSIPGNHYINDVYRQITLRIAKSHRISPNHLIYRQITSHIAIARHL